MDPHSTPPRKKQATDESSWQELSSVASCTRKIHDCLDDSIEKTEVEIEKVMKPSPWTQKNTEICRTMSGVLSIEECHAIMDRSETMGFKPALLNIGGGVEIYQPNARKSDRVMVDDPKFAASLYERLQGALPQSKREGGIKYVATGLNERMRILRYKEGHAFPAHHDGRYQRSDGSEVSFYTIMIYLNEGFAGGDTVLFPDSRFRTDKESISITPKPGLVLCFDHYVEHEGALLKEGVKYAIRTDLMFTETQIDEDQKLKNNSNERA